MRTSILLLLFVTYVPVSAAPPVDQEMIRDSAKVRLWYDGLSGAPSAKEKSEAQVAEEVKEELEFLEYSFGGALHSILLKSANEAKAATKDPKEQKVRFAKIAETKLSDEKTVTRELSGRGLAPAAVTLGRMLLMRVTSGEILAVLGEVGGALLLGPLGRIARTIVVGILGQSVFDMLSRLMPAGEVSAAASRSLLSRAGGVAVSGVGHLLQLAPFIIAGVQAYRATPEQLKDRSRMDVFCDSLIFQGTFGIVPGIADTRNTIRKGFEVMAQDPSLRGSLLEQMYLADQAEKARRAR